MGDSGKDCYKMAEKDVISDSGVPALRVCSLASRGAAELQTVCKMLSCVLVPERVRACLEISSVWSH